MKLRHLISAADLDVDDVVEILDTAQRLLPIARRERNTVPTLRGRVVCNLFLEDSTRTRLSFDIAAKRLSAEVINFSASGSSVSKGESFKDTALTLDAMGVDCVVVRSGSAGAPVQLAGYLDVPILNAGDGGHQHPTQALLDAFTLRRHLGDLAGRRIAIVGDVLHSRVARSQIDVFATLGAELVLVAPPTLLPSVAVDWKVTTVTDDLDGVVAEVDAVCLLRVQRERMHGAYFPSTGEYARRWGLNGRRLAAMRPEACVLHPGPMNRGIEISGEVADSPRTLATEQVTNGIAVRMACLYLLLAGVSTDTDVGRDIAETAESEAQ